jgi:O-antigen/teichoic acid export membrane protein
VAYSPTVFVRATYHRGAAGPATEAGDGPRLGSAVAASLAGKVAEMVTLLLLATVVPRALGPADYGRFAVPLTVVTLGSLALTLGGPTVMARFVPAAPPSERLALARAIGGRLARGRSVQVAVLAAGALVAVAWDPSRVPPLETCLVVAALALNVATSLALQTTLGLGRTVAWSLRFPLQNAVLIATVLVLHALAGATGAVIAIVVSAVAGAGLAAAAAWPVVAARLPRVPVPAGAVRFGALHAAGAALVQCSHRGGVLAVALLASSPDETGYAALAVGIALGATYAVLQAFTVSLPHVAHPSGGAATEGEAVLRRLAAGLLVVLVPAAVVAALVLDAAVPAVFGTDYEGAVDAFGPALALVVLAPLNALAVQVAALRLRPEVALASGIASAVGFVVVAVVAVPAWGAAGGTAGALAGVAAGAFTSLRLLPGVAGRWIGLASFAGAAGVLALAVVT